MSDQKVICHFTSSHGRYDVRIFHKECRSLASQGYKVFLVVADGGGDEIREKIHIVDVGLGRSRRFIRRLANIIKFLKVTIKIRANLYHFHDPDLLPVGLLLSTIGKHVVYDSHENYPRIIMQKQHIRQSLKKSLAKSFSLFEDFASRQFSAVIAATPAIRDRFQSVTSECFVINNYPILDEFKEAISWEDKEDSVCYIGRIAQKCGIRELVKAMEYVQGSLKMAGYFRPSSFGEELTRLRGWRKVECYGTLSRGKVSELLAQSKAGVVTFHPLPNHYNAQPNKLFEYMAAGIPVIASNFPFWKQLVEGSEAGICVDPLDPMDIAERINFLLNDGEQARRMGRNGSKAAVGKYNWSIEELKLWGIYRAILIDTRSSR